MTTASAKTGGAQVGPGEGVVLPNPVGGRVTLMVRSGETNGTFTVLETEVGPNEGPPLHAHSNEEETLYVLEGRFRFRRGDEIREASPGSLVFLPRGLPHCFQNVGEEPGRLLVTFAPSGMERFFERFSEIAAEHDAAEAFGLAAGESGMTVLGPPLARSHPNDAA